MNKDPKNYFPAIAIGLFALACLRLAGCSGLPQGTAIVTQPSASPLPLPKLTNIADSECAKYSWKDRGRAPAGYIQGLAETFRRSLCRGDGFVGAKALGDTDHDALAWYGVSASLVNDYTLLTGLGMRESSGNYGEGYDTSAGSETASEAEAGAWQFSYNSIGADASLRRLYEAYTQSIPDRCLLDVFKVGAKGNRQNIVGSGEGATFQTFTKKCPAFAAEYAATLVRVLRKHFGPLNRKEAEFRPECQAIFQQIKDTTSCQ